ncbi:prolipoprotein diacylglyceryl transferase [Mycobacterium hubeiense]|uniref:prolipoprotein diacylglyceryl transferase n=1 Tax=Mycobacterium hubeiense TaxID=1867256 RepID=UPI000C7E8F79|nr:prolipoprotein diacylglyceryl transferase [Mycobacterium sp. QGD 101]
MTTTVLASIPSPPQGVWYLGSFPLRAYALFIIAGIIVALVIGDRRWEARGGERGVIYDIALWAVPFGLIGGRLYHVITDWQTYFGEGGAGLGAAFRIWDGGLGIWGAVALGGVGAWIACRRRGIPLPAFGDAIAPGIVLAQAIGRLGNYFNQELYGRPTTLPWGLEIYERRDASGALDNLNGVSTGQLIEVVHPTFLYELLWNVLVFAVLIWVDRRFKIGHGRLFALYVAGYCVGRFWIELMRSDVATHIAGIRINSFTATFVFVGAVVYIMAAPKGREDPDSLRGKPTEVEELEESPVDEVAKELAAVAAGTGVVAAAKVAGEAEDEDAEAVGDEVDAEAMEPDSTEAEAEAEEPEAAVEEEEPAEPEAVEVGDEVEAEAMEPDEAEAMEPAEAEAEAEVGEEEPAAAEAVEAEVGEEEPAGVEAESAEMPEDVDAEAAAPEAMESDEATEPRPEEGLGPVEGEEAAEAQEAALEAHEVAVEGAEEATAVADEVAAEEADESELQPEVSGEEAEESEPEAAGGEAVPEPVEATDEEPVDESETEQAGAASDEPVEGLGPVEGEEATAVQEAASEAHQVAAEGADEAATVADEISADVSKPSEDVVEPESPQDTQAPRRRWWQRLRR